MVRHQLPVYSPLPFRAVLSGLAAALTGGRSARRAVRQTLEEDYAPDGLLLTDSGTSALTLALRAVGETGPDGPVALPAYSCYDVLTAAVGADVPVLFYDVEPRTLSPDLESLSDTVRKGASAVVVAHLYGIPVDMNPVMELTEEAGIPVIEDAAQAAGGHYRGRPLGTFGDLSILSFGRGKGTTGCGGGALLANDALGSDLLSRVDGLLPEDYPRGWRLLPVSVGQWLFGRPRLYSIPASLPFLQLGETVYREPEPPGRMAAVSLGILGVTIEQEERELGMRRRRARRMNTIFSSESGLSIVEPPAGSSPGYLRYPIVAEDRLKEALSGQAAESLGIMPGYPKPLYRLEATAERTRNRAFSLPGSEVLASGLYTLPTHSLMNSDDARLVNHLRGAAQSRRSVTTEEDAQSRQDVSPTAVHSEEGHGHT